MTNSQYKIIVRIYQAFRALRYSLLHSVFGYVSHCKHSPTCGTYLLKQIKQNGLLLGGFRGILRVLQCW